MKNSSKDTNNTNSLNSSISNRPDLISGDNALKNKAVKPEKHTDQEQQGQPEKQIIYPPPTIPVTITVMPNPAASVSQSSLSKQSLEKSKDKN